MRFVMIFSLAVLGLTQNAWAADPPEDEPFLRGSEVYEPPAPKVYTRWSGFYGGGQVEYGSGNFDFSKATQSLASWSLRNLALETEEHVSSFHVLDKKHTGSAGFGGFAGYNWQFEDVVLGLELSYTQNSFSAVALSSPMSRVFSAGGQTYNVTVDGAGAMNIREYAELRGRVGYAWGCALPYATLGLALGHGDFSRAWSIVGTENPGTTNAVPFSFANSEAKSSVFMFGWSLGAGIDVALMKNVFVRAEIDYIQFAPISGIEASMVVGRLGGGLKF